MFTYFVLVNHGKSFNKISIVSILRIHFYFTLLLYEMSILRTLTWESSTYYFAFRLTDKSILLSTQQYASVATESNLNRLFLSPHIFIINA